MANKNFLKKPHFEAIAKEVLADVPKSDKPARRMAWCSLVDAYQKDRQISQWQASNWTVPKWVAGGK